MPSGVEGLPASAIELLALKKPLLDPSWLLSSSIHRFIDSSDLAAWAGLGWAGLGWAGWLAGWRAGWLAGWLAGSARLGLAWLGWLGWQAAAGWLLLTD